MILAILGFGWRRRKPNWAVCWAASALGASSEIVQLLPFSTATLNSTTLPPTVSGSWSASRSLPWSSLYFRRSMPALSITSSGGTDCRRALIKDSARELIEMFAVVRFQIGSPPAPRFDDPVTPTAQEPFRLLDTRIAQHLPERPCCFQGGTRFHQGAARAGAHDPRSGRKRRVPIDITFRRGGDCARLRGSACSATCGCDSARESSGRVTRVVPRDKA